MMMVVVVLVVLVMTVSIVVVVTLFIVTVMGSVGRGSLSNTVHRYTLVNASMHDNGPLAYAGMYTYSMCMIFPTTTSYYDPVSLEKIHVILPPLLSYTVPFPHTTSSLIILSLTPTSSLLLSSQ